LVADVFVLALLRVCVLLYTHMIVLYSIMSLDLEVSR